MMMKSRWLLMLFISAPVLAADVSIPAAADLAGYQEQATPTVQTSTSTYQEPTAPAQTATTTTTTTVVKKPPSMIMVEGTGANSKLVEPQSYEELQETMLKSAPPAMIPTHPESEEAFNLLMQQSMPLNPQQIIRLHQLIDASQRAAATPALVPPKPVSSTLLINLAPGVTPPAIRLAQGHVTSLVFVDSTGAPWPVASYDLGDPKAISMQWDGKSNVMLMQASQPYLNSDLVIRLVGLMTPITLELVSGQRVVDYRTDIHVPGLGPNSKDVPMGSNLPNSANQLLLSVLDGIAPPSSRPLLVKGGDCQAWLLGDKMYLRTRYTLLSPGWIGRMVSPDGTNAYEVQRSATVLISRYGEPVELKIEGF